MPLRLAITNKYGIDCDYWVVTQFNINIPKKEAHVVIEGWSSRAKYVAGFTRLDYREFDWIHDDFPFGDGTGNLLRITYDKIKTLAPFSTATEEV